MKTNKMVALAFILLMFGSSVGAFITSVLKPSTEVQVPKERILDYELSESQKRYLLARGYTILKFSYPHDCFECETQKRRLEEFTQNSEGQIFLQELTGNTNATVITITSFKGQKILNNPSDEEMRSSICEMMLRRPLWCVSV